MVTLFVDATPLRAGELRQLTTDGAFKQRPVWSPDGKFVLYTRHRGEQFAIVRMTAEGTDEKVITPEKLPEYDACWSPDGERIAFTHVFQTLGQGNLDVFIAKADGTEPAKFAGDHKKLSHEEYPAWSPDGKHIAYSSTYQGNQEIYIGAIDGGKHVRLTSDPALDAHPAWSPDGKRLAFATSRWGDFEIALCDADGENIERLTESAGLDDYPVFSPDGRRLAFVSNRDGSFEIYVLDLTDRSLRNVTDDPSIDTYPAWTPDGRLGFVSNRSDNFEIYVMKLD
jgi:TolB protein